MMTLTLGWYPNPRAMADTIVLFPVPFGPIIMLRFGPGLNSTKSLRLNLRKAGEDVGKIQESSLSHKILASYSHNSSGFESVIEILRLTSY